MLLEQDLRLKGAKNVLKFCIRTTKNRAAV